MPKLSNFGGESLKLDKFFNVPVSVFLSPNGGNWKNAFQHINEPEQY